MPVLPSNTSPSFQLTKISMRPSGGLKNGLPDLVELPEESLAHHPRRASRNHIPIGLALHNLSEQRLLPDVRKQSFPNTGSRSQRCLWNLLSFNSHLPLPWNEKNPDFPRLGSPCQKESSSAENIKTPSLPGLAAQV